MLNGAPLNSTPLNGAATTEATDWEAAAPVERIAIYVLDVGSLRVPITSAQATMRATGQSFLQVVVPNGGEYIEALEPLVGETMVLRSGYRYADDTLSPLEPIAQAPFELLRSDEGTRSHSLTLSGYGAVAAGGTSSRQLRGVRYRSTDGGGNRRTRCSIDLFLRPGHQAVDTDGLEYPVGVIQYFINADNEFMEVMQSG